MKVNLKESLYYKDPSGQGEDLSPSTLVIVDMESPSDAYIKLEGVSADFFKFIEKEREDDMDKLMRFLDNNGYSNLDRETVERDFKDFLEKMSQLKLVTID